MVPEKLKKGDGVAVFSPSLPATRNVPKRYQRAKKYLIDKGFELIEGSLTGKSDYYRSGSIQDRAKELNQLIHNPKVKCIISAIGGINSNSILPYIDYEALKKNPKIIMGYSDVTALLLGIYAKTGLTTYYGPAVVASFGEFPPLVEETYSYFSDIVVNELKFPYKIPMPLRWTEEMIDWESQDRPKKMRDNQWLTLEEGKVKGRFIGGNLNTISGIWGTDYMPEIREGDVLFLEDSLLDIGTAERSFSHLKLAGVFDKIGGLLIGKHEKFDHMGTEKTYYDVCMEVIGQCDFPILAEFDCCHTHPMLTMPIGCEIELDTSRRTVTIISEETKNS